MRRHRLDPFSLVFGATFAFLGGLFLFGRADLEDLHLKWVWPVPLIVLGVLIIALSARENRLRAERADELEAAGPAAGEEPAGPEA